MSQASRITQELSIGDVLSKTFELYKSQFVKYVILFAVVEAVIGALDTTTRYLIKVPVAPPIGSSPFAVLSTLGTTIELAALSGIITLVFLPLSYGSVVKMASQEIETGQVDFTPSVRYALSRLVWIWVVGLVVGIIVFLGFIALIVPGIILAIMFSLVLPIIIIEKSDFKSMGRSRELASHRWLKTFALFIVFAIIIGIASAIVSFISAPFGFASSIVSSILSALYLPLLPIMLTVYYYSNVARLSPTQPIPPPTAPPTDQTVMRYCPSCGSQLSPGVTFCPSCGTKLSP